jgi:hypothetical protein
MKVNNSKQFAALDAARDDLAAAQRRLDADTTSLESARQFEAATVEKLENARTAAAAEEAEQVLKLDASIRNGAALIGMQGALDKGVALELAKATHANKIATLAVKTAAKRHAQSAEAVQAKRSALETAADAILNAEQETLAADIERAYAHLVNLVEQLRAIVPDALFLPANVAVAISTTVAAALGRVPAPDLLHTPVNVLRYGRHAESGSWAARRTALIRGEENSTEDSVAA